MIVSAKARAQAQQLLDFIDASPSPWHAVASTVDMLQAQGFSALDEKETWQLNAHGKYYVVRGGSSIIAFVLGQKPLVETGLRIVGAHTDSPSLRLKPKAAFGSHGLVQLGVEVYGSPILATFADRDLSLAGCVHVRSSTGHTTHLVRFDAPLLRLPNLAIHMNREVNEQGLKFNKQTELPPIFSIALPDAEPQTQFAQQLASQLNVAETDILTWELNIYDTQKGSFWGGYREFIANSQLDNLASCHAALSAMLINKTPNATSMCALFDHEEVGSESSVGAGGSLIADVIKRISLHEKLTEEALLRMLAQSFFVSADMAHAYHPNHASAYEPCHHAHVNLGPVIKSNNNQRYSTSAASAARFIQLCGQADVPYQQYVHRTDLGCGSTIGPMVAAQLGINSVDVGNPMWAMHSLRESAGALDHSYMISALGAHFSS